MRLILTRLAIQKSNCIINVLIEKSTLRTSTTGAGASNLASLISADVTNFDGILSSADVTVQLALDTIDDKVVEVQAT